MSTGSTAEIKAAARALLAAKDRLLAAEGEAIEARNRYREAEEAYFKAHGNGDNGPTKVVLDGKAILPCEDWYELKQGARLEFHTVEVLS